MQDLTEFLLCFGLCAEFAITASVVRNCLLGSAGISLQLVTYQECYKSYFSLSYLLHDFGRIKVHFSLLMRFSPAELLVKCPGKLHIVISGIVFLLSGKEQTPTHG